MSLPPSAPFQPASLALRLAAMIYEAVLLFGVVFIVAYALLALFQWKYPLPPGPRAARNWTWSARPNGPR